MSELFRKKAVENYREQFSIDSNITKISTSFIAIACVFVVGVLLALMWFVFGNIVDTIDVSGVVYPTAGIERLNATKSGIISDIKVSVGDDVNVGDVVAVIPDDELLEEIENALNNGADDDTVSALRQKYASDSIVRAKSSGTVLSVANDGDYVNAGDFVASVAARNRDDNARQIIAFLPTNRKNSISIGCKVQVSPDYAPREKYGYINGYIADIDNSIVTKNDLLKSMDIYNIPELTDDEQTYITVRINLMPDEQTESGLNWSVKHSGDINVVTGTVCNISVIESSMPPYKWLFGGT